MLLSQTRRIDGLGFMGKAWDTFNPDTVRANRAKADARNETWHGQVYKPGVARDAGKYDLSRNAQFQEWFYTVAVEMLRVLKPGGHLLSFGGSRTYHRMACAIEDAGFEIRDQLMWLYGSGFPKSLDVGKAIDKAAGAEREVVGKHSAPADSIYTQGKNKLSSDVDITTPATPEAKRWDGWGTALKPAHEPIVLARKPFTGTVAANVLEHGVGALNIDGCRIEGESGNGHWTHKREIGGNGIYGGGGYQEQDNGNQGNPPGRFPANLILDPEAGGCLDEQATPVAGGIRNKHPNPSQDNHVYSGGCGAMNDDSRVYPRADKVSRFFYCAKASRRERNGGLDGVEEKQNDTGRKKGNPGGDNPRNRGVHKIANHHPTVKPIALMRYLCKLITPPGGTILDPFTGSGTTLCAAVLEGFNYIGCELDAEYIEIATRRIAYFKEHGEAGLVYDPDPPPPDPNQGGLFN